MQTVLRNTRLAKALMKWQATSECGHLLRSAGWTKKSNLGSKMRKNVSDEYLKKKVMGLYQAINTISNNSDVDDWKDDYLAMELLDTLKVLVERKKLTKVERIAYEKNKRVFLSQVLMDALYPLLLEDEEYKGS